MPLPLTENDGKIRVVELFRGQGFGLESDDFLQAKKKFAIRVSDEIDYVVSFYFKQSAIEPSLELSMTSFNCDFDRKYTSKNAANGSPDNYFVKGDERIISAKERYFFCRYIIYSKNHVPVPSQHLTALGAGKNLIMESGTTNIFINLLCVRDKVRIWNFKVRPLRTPFSTALLGTSNLLEIWRKNNKKHMSDDEIDNLAKDYLLPYNSIQAVINL